MKKQEIEIEIKSLDDAGTFVAYGSTFGNEDFGGDVAIQGCFKKCLESKTPDMIYMFYQHDPKEIIGEYTAIKEDSHGLLIEGKLYINDIQRAKETYFLMQKKKIFKFSIGYRVKKDEWKGGVRQLKELDLVEVSPVTFPMNDRAELLTVKEQTTELTKREFEAKLRDVFGLSQKKAKSLLAGGWDEMNRDGFDHSIKEDKSNDTNLISLLNELTQKMRE